MLIKDKENLKKYEAQYRIWQGIPSIVRTKGGRTLISAYSGNVKETYGNYAFILMEDACGNFGEPVVVAYKEGDCRCYDPLLWIDPLNRLWFVWNVMPGEEVWASICENPDADELVFGKEFYIGRGVMLNKPCVLSSGEWLFPIAVWDPKLENAMRKAGIKEDEVFGAYVYKTSDNGETFMKLGYADIRDRSFDEHMVVELKNGVLMMLVRTNYGIGVSYSYDRGQNWGKGDNSKLGGPCSRFHIVRLKSGRILLINHYKYKVENGSARNNLAALLSEDDGKTYPYVLMLDERNFVSYPDAQEGDDGYIYIVYDRERGSYKSSLEEVYASAREIVMAKITEEDIINGAVKCEGSFTKRVVSKLGDLSPQLGDPFENKIQDDRELAETLIQEEKKDIISSVFEQYPFNCFNCYKIDMKKFDALIEQFHASQDKDVNLLVKIIKLVRECPENKDGIPPIIENVKKMIDEHIGEELSITELARMMKISVHYLAHLFKSVTGITVTEYRNEMRLTEAKKLLINTEKSITEIAIEVGFNSSTYFAEVFLKHENVSPKQYRKYHKR